MLDIFIRHHSFALRMNVKWTVWTRRERSLGFGHFVVSCVADSCHVECSFKMVFKWNDQNTLLFLENFQNYQCLWNHKLDEYKDRTLRANAIKSLISDLNLEVPEEDIKHKIKTIRTRYTIVDVFFVSFLSTPWLNDHKLKLFQDTRLPWTPYSQKRVVNVHFYVIQA